MDDLKYFKILYEKGLISDDSYKKMLLSKKNQTVSVHWELTTMLYLGVLLLSAGFGILVFKNIDSIGHKAIVISIAAISLGCFAYCFIKSVPYANTQVASPNIIFDYVLLLGCLSLLSFIAYIQFQYEVFGNRYGLASFIPLCILFFSAYYFDHLGVLGLAITNFATWMGLSITPMHLIQSNDFNEERIILTGLLVGALLLVAAFASRKTKVKSHFEFTYANFGIHVLLISAIAALIHYENIRLLLFVVFLAMVLLLYFIGMRRSSFYFVVVSVLYGYIGASYVIIDMLHWGSAGLGPLYTMVIYFIITGVLVARFLAYINKKLKKDDSI